MTAQDIHFFSWRDSLFCEFNVSWIRINPDRLAMRLATRAVHVKCWQVCSVHFSQEGFKIVGKRTLKALS
jgi:hypothetical protein